MTDPDNLMAFATRVAEGAGRITLQHFGGVEVEYKADGSEVTVADRLAEEYIRAEILHAFPEDAILGEETGGGDASVGSSRQRRRWIVDPIDGTRSFAAGVPLYGVLLTLEVGGSPVLGCCHFPVLRQTLVAATGAGAWLEGSPAQISDCDDLRGARVVTSGLEYWRDWASPPGQRGWHRLVRQCRFVRTWGDCYGYSLVATGRAEILADPAGGAVWDFLPMVPILREAGGRFTTLRGAPVSAWSTALASNSRIHDAAAACWGAGGMDDHELQSGTVLRRREG